MKKFSIILLFLIILAVAGGVYYKIQEDKTPVAKVEVGLQATALAPVSDISPVEKIKAKTFELLQVSPITFGEALDIANYVSELTKIRPAFLLAITQEELVLEKLDMCYLADIKSGNGIRITDGKIRPKTMHPTKNIPLFLRITKELGKDPLKTPITCPMSFGWGGAMGPADFIPSTWVSY